MKRGVLIRLLERDEFSYRTNLAADQRDYRQRCKQVGYIVEAVLDGGTRTQSRLIELDDPDAAVDLFLDLRGRTMVRQVRIFGAHTGEVFADLPSHNVVAAAAVARKTTPMPWLDLLIGYPPDDARRSARAWASAQKRSDGTVGACPVWINR